MKGKGKTKAKGKSENQVKKGGTPTDAAVPARRHAKTFLLPFALVFTWFSLALAKTADDYYHGAAYKYFAGRHQEAGVEVAEGLRAHPRDERLQNLAGLLEQMKDQQRQDQNQGGGGEPQNDPDSPPDPGENRPQDPQAGQDPPPEGGPDEEEKKKKQPGEESASAQDGPDSTGKGESAEQSEPPPRPGQMSREDAERLLNSFADDEKKEQRDLRRTPKRSEVEKDW